jgi:hypothetical protein
MYCQSYDDSLYTKHTINYNGCPCQCDIQRMSRSRWNTMDVQVKVKSWTSIVYHLDMDIHCIPPWLGHPLYFTLTLVFIVFHPDLSIRDIFQVKMKCNACPGQAEIQSMSRSRMLRSVWNTMNAKVKVTYNGCSGQGGIQWMAKSRWNITNA